jgi:transcriptional regulator with XRE-family HTH domain
MATGDPPAVARRRVWLALRRAREAKGLTQGQVAEEMEWSLSKVMRIEKGEVSISVVDLRALMDLLEIADPTEVKQLLDDARSSRSRGSAYSQHLEPGTQHLLQFEIDATAIRYFSLVLVPGILQTADYARAVFRESFGDLPQETVETRLNTRLHRRDHVIYRSDPPECLFLLDESVLHRGVGGPAVAGAQLRDLLRIMDETSKVLVRVVPMAAAAPIALLGPFQILDLESGGEILYKEAAWSDEIINTPALVGRHREVFEELWAHSLSNAESKKLIESNADRWLAFARSGQG